MTGRSVEQTVTILHWYSEFLPLIDPSTDIGKRYRVELFGVGEVSQSPDEYGDYSFYKEIGMDAEAFGRLDLHTRAKMKAHSILAGLVELRASHLRTQKDKLDKRTAEQEAKNRDKGKHSG